jgi:hypothetical protein
MLIKMDSGVGETENLVVSDLGMEERNKMVNNLSIIAGYGVKIEQGRARFVASGKEIKEFLNIL